MGIYKSIKHKPGAYVRIEGLTPPPPPTFDQINPEYPGNLIVLADMARPCFDGEIYWIMHERLKSLADANGETERIEETTGIKIKTFNSCPYGYLLIGQIETSEHIKVFPAGIMVAVDWQEGMRLWD